MSKSHDAPAPGDNSAKNKHSRLLEQFQDFYGRDFLITPDVLVPRPETEQLVDLVLSLAGKPYLPGMRPSDRQLPKSPTILDVGTGSGCIAITLALEIPHAQILASDVSSSALAVARQNAQNFALELPFFESDLLYTLLFEPPETVAKPAKSSKHYASTPGQTSKIAPPSKKVLPTPDLVVANLPYVDKTWSWVDPSALAGEPDLALYADDGGLALIKELIKQCRDRQIPRLVLEADPCQHTLIAEFADRHNYHLDRIMGYALSLERLAD